MIVLSSESDNGRNGYASYLIITCVYVLYRATTGITYTALIQGYLRAHVKEHSAGRPASSPSKFNVATKLIERMKAHGHPLNEVIEHALLDTLLSTGELNSALELFKSSRRDVEAYGIVLRRLKEMGEITVAKKVVGELRKQMSGGGGEGSKLMMLPRWVGRIVLDIEHSW